MVESAIDSLETFERLEGTILPSRFTMVLKVLQSLPDTKSFDLEMKSSVARTSLFFSSMLSTVAQTCAQVKSRKFKTLLALKILRNRGLVNKETEIFEILFNEKKDKSEVEVSADFQEWITDTEFSFFLPFENVSYTCNHHDKIFLISPPPQSGSEFSCDSSGGLR